MAERIRLPPRQRFDFRAGKFINHIGAGRRRFEDYGLCGFYRISLKKL
jgi:hypothetical protein